MSIFKHFWFSESNNNKMVEPKNKSTWITHGFSELIGTISLTMLFAGIGIVISSSGTQIEHFLLNNVLISMYAGFIAISLLLFVFLRWSCDLNPGVTLTRMLKGTNTLKYGLFKISIQFIGGIIAGLLIYGFGSIANHIPEDAKGLKANSAISILNIVAWDETTSTIGHSKALFGAKLFHNPEISKSGAYAIGFIWILVLEMILMMILLWPIFSGVISDKYRDFFIAFIIALAVAVGILGGTVAINPARGLGQQVPSLFFGFAAGGAKSNLDVALATIAMMCGNIIGAFLFVLFQGVLENFINPMYIRIISYKNIRNQSLKEIDRKRKK